MIEAHELTKRYGGTTAVHSLSFTIAPGTVTGFLGPNGAGKSTTMRMIMGLDRPTSGTVTVNGKPYRQHRAPLREVGALLEASAVHPGRSARSHLRSMAATHNIKASRVSEVEMTGLAGVATKRVGGFSLGMGQRLGIAAALLGDPRTLILDERSTGSTPRACSGSASSCAPWPHTTPSRLRELWAPVWARDPNLKIKDQAARC
jgi:ABC-2 type transport system ATP-binding protein